MKLNAKAFALAAGILWGIGLVVLTVISMANGYAAQFMSLMADVYPGYSVSATGIIVGAIYGFLDGFICCYIFAWLYNKLAK